MQIAYPVGQFWIRQSSHAALPKLFLQVFSSVQQKSFTSGPHSQKLFATSLDAAHTFGLRKQLSMH